MEWLGHLTYREAFGSLNLIWDAPNLGAIVSVCVDGLIRSLIECYAGIIMSTRSPGIFTCPFIKVDLRTFALNLWEISWLGADRRHLLVRI